MKTKKYTSGKLYDACPGCMGTLEEQLKSHQKYGHGFPFRLARSGFLSTHDAGDPVWRCDNCNHTMPRQTRRPRTKKPLSAEEIAVRAEIYAFVDAQIAAEAEAK